jgi:hypothetical protein
LGVCLPEGFTPATERICYTSAQLNKINPREPMGGRSTSQGALGDALCVYKENFSRKVSFPNAKLIVCSKAYLIRVCSATQSFYFTEDALQDSTIFSSPEGQKSFDYLTASTALSTVASTSSDSIYDQNDTIPAFQLFAGSYENYVGVGYFSVPRPDFSGLCNDNNYAQFEDNQDKETCYRGISSEGSSNGAFEDQCTDQSLARYVSDLFVGLNADSVSTDTSELVSVTLNSLSYEDPISGSLTDILSAWNTGDCATESYSRLQVNQTVIDSTTFPCLFMGPASLSSTYSNDVISLCSGIVRSVAYTVNHNSTGNNDILSLLADVVITDLVLQLPLSGVSPFEQSFSIDFVGKNGEAAAEDNGNQVRR